MSTPFARHEFDEGAIGPLKDVRVLDLSRLVAGNLLTKVLADHGAEVIKVEPGEGDTLRAWKVAGVATAWKIWARNKKSIALDLRSDAGIGLVRQLAASSHILVESFRPGVLEAMGLDPAVLLAANPKLVIVRISGWGQSGPYRHKPGFGTLVEGYAGFADVNGYEDRPPVLPPMFMADSFAGLYGATAAMIALRVAEEVEGEGQIVDVSLIDPLLAVMDPQIANFRVTGRTRTRTGSRSANTAPRNAYRTRDDHWLALSASTEGMTKKLFGAIGMPELAADARFRDNASRIANVDELDRIIGDFMRERTRDELLALFERAGVTAGPIMGAAALEQDGYLRAHESLIEVPDEDMDWLPMHGAVPRLSKTPGIFARPAPALGEHSREVLEPIVGASTFSSLVAEGIVIVPSA